MKLQLEIAGRLRSVELEIGNDKPGDSARRYAATLDGQPIEFEAQLLHPGVLSLLIGHRAYRVVFEDDAEEPAVYIAGERHLYRIDDPRSLKARRSHTQGHDGPKPIKASMPGRVVRLLAQPGDTVEVNQGVVVIEAMKMQNELKSPKAGKVADLRVAPGDTVTAGEVLAVIE
jgi:biotin carboxyl carrier protein